jgi:hypothetical protein
MDEVIFVAATAVAVLASLYLFALSRVKFLKKNWVEYRCNPIYMPMAGLVGDSVVSNFTKCTMKGFQDYAGFVMDPIMGEFAVVNDTVGEIGETMGSMRTMMSGVRGGFLGILGTVFGKIQNLISQFQYIIIRMRTLLSRVVGVMLSFIYVFYTGMDTGESVMNGPIGKTVSFLCFDPATPVRLFGGQTLPLAALKIGDVLQGGHTITATYLLSGANVDMYLLNGIAVSGSHRVAHNGVFVPVSEHPRAVRMMIDLPVIACIDTHTHRIQMGETEFLDFRERDLPARNYPPETPIVTNDNRNVPISQVILGMSLKGNNRVIGVVVRPDGHNLITETGRFTFVQPNACENLVVDDLFYSKICR